MSAIGRGEGSKNWSKLPTDSTKKQQTLKRLLKSVWEGKMHGRTKIGIFVHCFVSECLANQPTTVLELGLSVALFELNRTI